MIFVYGFLAISLLVLVSISRLDRLSPRIYLVYGVALSVLALLKPLGTTPDDLNYVELAAQGCTSFACDGVLSLSRDFIWFFLVSFAPPNGEFFVIKLISAIALGVKLFVIYKLSSNKIYALCTYTFVFYFLHDLTQYRVSLALAFFLLAIYFAARSNRLNTTLAGAASIGSHIQAAPSALLLLSPGWLKDRLPFLATISVLLLLVALGLFPQLDRLAAGYGLLTGQDYDASSDVGKYIHLADAGDYLGFRNVSIVAFVILLSLWLLKPDVTQSPGISIRARTIFLSQSSIALAFALYLAFASVLDMQNRFFEFFLVPLVLVVGNCRHTLRNYLSLVFLCASVFVKFHLISDFFST